MILVLVGRRVSDSFILACVITVHSERSLLGTYWYHSHITTQYCDGLRGPLVIYDPHDPQKHLYDVDDGRFYNHASH